MSQYPNPTNNVLATNVNGAGDDVMIYGTLNAKTLRAAYEKSGVTFDDIYDVPDKDVAFYLYEPCYLTFDEEAQARRLAAGNTKQKETA